MDTIKLLNNGRLFMCVREFLINKTPSAQTIESISKLLNECADINAQDGNDNNNTVLHIIVSMNENNEGRNEEEKNLVNYLLDNGARILPNRSNKTPIDLASENNKNDIVKILNVCKAKHDDNKYKNKNDPNHHRNIQLIRELSSQNNNIAKHSDKIQYEKRPGTSGASGQFYESKLLSLVLYRALHDHEIKDFILATNINGIGDLDDVCFRIDFFENDQPVLCFLQAKHKEDPNKAKLSTNNLRNPSGPFSIIKYFESFIKIKQRITSTSKDPMFQGEFHKLQCYFILYTPLKECFSKKRQNKAMCNKLHNFIYTGAAQNNISDVFQFKYASNDIDLLTTYMQQENMKKLGKVFLDFILPGKNRSYEMMTSELIRIYHPALAKYVIHLKERCEGRFRDDFFSTTDEKLIALRTCLIEGIIAKNDKKKIERSKLDMKKEIKKILKAPNVLNISQLIEVLHFNEDNCTLKLDVTKLPTFYTQEDINQIDNDLQTVKVDPKIIKETLAIVGKKKLKALTFDLPTSFGHGEIGNLDLEQVDILELGKELLNYTISNETNNLNTNSKLISLYHPLLAQKVISINTFYEGNFRVEFLDNDDVMLSTLKYSLMNDIVFGQNTKTDMSIKEIEAKVNDIKRKPCSDTISKLLGKVLTIDKDNSKLKVDKTKVAISQTEREKIDNILQKVHFTPDIIKKAVTKVGRQKLQSLVFKLPHTFGNIDFITNKHKKGDIEKRLEFFAEKFSKLIKGYGKTLKINNNYSLKPTKNIVVLEINSKVITDKIFEVSHINDIGGIGGAVGNLLQFDSETKMYMFNTKEETLKQNAKYMLGRIKELSSLTLQELNNYRIIINLPTCTFPRNDFSVIEYDKQMAKEFLNQLWFYTNQANEEKVEHILKTEIDNHYNQDKLHNQFFFRVYSDAIFLRFHDEVQKWWKSQVKAKYFTKTSNIFEEAKKSIVESPLLTVLNNMFIRNIRKVDVCFNTNSINSFMQEVEFQKSKSDKYKAFNIISDIVTLSVVKYMQCFENEQLLDLIFINLDYVNVLPESDYNTMMDELKNTKSVTLIVCSETGIDERTSKKLADILQAFEGNIVVITDKPIDVSPRHYLYIEDHNICLKDLTHKSQNNILENFEVVYQGEVVKLNKIIDEDSIALINGKLLWSIINNVKIEIGFNLNSHKYDEIKNNYINRSLFRDKEEFEVNTLNDIEDEIVIISSKPCAGKTILLTHLSLETKKVQPQLWIIHIPLSEYIKDFSEFEQKDIDILCVFKFMCNVALKNNHVLKNIELDFEDNRIVIKNGYDSENIIFEMKLFADFFNNGKVLCLFDGFERVCPRSTQNAIDFFRILQQVNKRMWITSSCYYVNILEREFQDSYELPLLTENQQRSFLDRFFETNLKLETLNHEQYNNIALFFKFIFNKTPLDQNADRPVMPLLSIPMQLIYVSAVEYFKNEIENLTPAYLRETLKKKWSLDSYTAVDRYFGRSNEEQSLELAGTPLHMYLAANYFEVQIKERFRLCFDDDEFSKNSKIYLNLFTSCQRFLQNNLHNLISHNNDHDNQSLPADQNTIRDKFLEDHKILALYALCKEKDISKVLSKKQREHAEKLIKEIESGEVTTPLIDCVIDGVPRFYHLIFAEYFLIELVTDLIRSVVNKNTDTLELDSVWDVIVNSILLCSTAGVRNAFEYKLKCDPELAEVAGDKQSSKIIFNLIMKQKNENVEQSEDRETALNEAINRGCVNTTNFLLKAMQSHVNTENVDGFLSIIKSGIFVLGTMKSDWKIATDDVVKFIKSLDGPILISLLNSGQADGLPQIVETVLTQTEFGQRIHDRLKSLVKNPIQKSADTLLALSSNNENLALLFNTLSQNLPEIVDGISSGIAYLAEQMKEDENKPQS